MLISGVDWISNCDVDDGWGSHDSAKIGMPYQKTKPSFAMPNEHIIFIMLSHSQKTGVVHTRSKSKYTLAGFAFRSKTCRLGSYMVDLRAPLRSLNCSSQQFINKRSNQETCVCQQWSYACIERFVNGRSYTNQAARDCMAAIVLAGADGWLLVICVPVVVVVVVEFTNETSVTRNGRTV